MVRVSFVSVSACSLVCWALASAVGAQCPGTWSLVATSGPAPGGGTSMVFDEARGVSVLFDLGETWTWDGASWSLVATTGPAPRWEQAMTYDLARSRVVLFGGTDSVTVFGDTWEWDGVTWTQVASSGPLPRHGHVLGFHPVSATTALFGGIDEAGGFPNDIWDWDGTQWTARTSPGFGGRAYPAMSRSPTAGSNRLFVFGGISLEAGGAIGETWSIAATSWRLENPCGVGGRDQSSMVWDSLRGRLVLFGGRGFSDDFLEGETWEMEPGATWRLTSMTGPSARRSTAMAFDSLRGRTVLFGGITDTAISGETWEYSPVAVPGTPTDLAVSEVRKGVTLLTWNASSTTGASCAIERDAWNGSSWSATVTAGLVGPGIAKLVDLPGTGPFRYRVQASTCAGDSAWAPDVIVVPTTPGNLVGDFMIRRSATFTWPDRSDFETTFEVQRERSAGGGSGPWTLTTIVAILPQDSTYFSQNPGVGYWRYRVRSVNPGGASSWTPWLVIQVR